VVDDVDAAEEVRLDLPLLLPVLPARGGGRAGALRGFDWRDGA
jgi:hypothetical protein